MLVVAIISLVLALVSIAVSFYLYRWRTFIIEDQRFLVPEALVKELKAQNAQLNSISEALPRLEENASDENRLTRKAVNETKDSLLGFQSKLDEKDAEISRYRYGFDIHVYRKFLRRYFRVFRLLEELEASSSVTSKDISKLKIMFEDALEESGVEIFSPDIGINYLENGHILDDDPEIVATMDSDKDYLVESVVRTGLKSLATEEIIIKPKVRVFRMKGEE